MVTDYKSATTGEINQVKVAAETGFRYTGNQYDGLNKLIDDYSKDKTIDLSKKLQPNPAQNKFYEEQGKKLRDNYLELNPTPKSGNDTNKTKGSEKKRKWKK
ncbi:MAG: hypothetical protein IT237_11185 [Bacteroidia bacterium]|nr:hypothetical protein [Bacteroidia bacterium]